MTSNIIPFPIDCKDDLSDLEQPRTVADARWGVVCEDIWHSLEYLQRLYDSQGVLVLQEHSGTYRGIIGQLATDEEVTPAETNIKTVDNSEDGDDAVRKDWTPSGSYVTDAYIAVSYDPGAGWDVGLTGTGEVGVRKAPFNAIKIDEEDIVLTLGERQDLDHKTTFHLHTHDQHWQIWRFDEEDYDIHESLRDRVFVDVHPALTEYHAYIEVGDIIHLAISSDESDMLMDSIKDDVERVTPDHPSDGTEYHPCKVVGLRSNGVTVDPLGSDDDDVREFKGKDLARLLDGKILPAPRSEQTFTHQTRKHREAL